MEEHQDEKRVNEDERIAESVSDMLFDDGAATEAEAMPDAPAGDDAPEFVAEGEGHGAAVPEGAYPQAPLQYDGEADAEAPDDAPYIAPVGRLCRPMHSKRMYRGLRASGKSAGRNAAGHGFC